MVFTRKRKHTKGCKCSRGNYFSPLMLMCCELNRKKNFCLIDCPFLTGKIENKYVNYFYEFKYYLYSLDLDLQRIIHHHPFIIDEKDKFPKFYLLVEILSYLSSGTLKSLIMVWTTKTKSLKHALRMFTLYPFKTASYFNCTEKLSALFTYIFSFSRESTNKRTPRTENTTHYSRSKIL